jgi:chorismate lyase/3-hydroxybenzoate synthase
LRPSFFKPDQPDLQKREAAFAVHYVPQGALPDWLRRDEIILGIIGYGAPTPGLLAASHAFTPAPLSPITGEAVFEIWTAPGKLQALQAGSVSGKFNEHLAFGAAIVSEQDGLETGAERAYLDIFDFLKASGGKVPLRFWNYPVAITGDDNGLERYRRYNIGRHRAFVARLEQEQPPAATAVGGHGGASIIYFLAASEAATPVENPRQVSAYHYPRIYGPRSPSFSRASIYVQNDAACLFVSGTASIVGHETRHEGDLAGQIAETAKNLRAVIEEAEKRSVIPLRGEWALKIYLHDAAALPLVAPVADAVFGAGAQRIYLRGDICRRELLVEIEAFRQF